MYRQIFVYLPPHTWTNLSCMDGGHKNVSWNKNSLYLRGCHGSFNELGLNLYTGRTKIKEKCDHTFSKRICDNINECEKMFEKSDKIDIHCVKN